MKSLSRKNLSISESMTLAISAKANQMKAEGADIISFGAGEPDFNTPEYIRTAAIKQIEKGGNGYTAASGLPDLKRAIASKLKRDNGLTYANNQIVVSSGAKHSLFNALQAICNPGDEVIIPSPYWVSYYELVKLADAEPVLVEGDAKVSFKVTPSQLEAAITPATKALMLNSPNNPTGTVYTESELKAIADLAIKHDLYIISDEIYEKLIYGETHVSIAKFAYDHTILVNGLSKAYAMTGWRIGYTASSVEIAKIMSNIQSHATSNPNTIAQYASIEALDGDQSPIEEMRLAFDERRKYMVERVRNIDKISCVEPKGAFYVMVDISHYLGLEIEGKKVESSIDFASLLLEKAMVSVIPGIAFGVDAYIRLSYATSMENIKEGLNRIEAFCNKY
ncbi:pyridoxal phosphate-dependent aminotransferase [Fusibacter tunisiensis]|jgi:aspartate aminotransferase|uniref:Aminotransferase n=1 Tax=Fusibacter tunisiensis TaxID=1008308 RepID=A0ABS2MQ50_9FIRM|nr:pyridoxal phosphate-dependent aminotransferase [Fusibacter tunisiensis]MBM7561533.1 aspartate aminotransferase [Fusibacter tunisiensis]